jgi:hypothetical protein
MLYKYNDGSVLKVIKARELIRIPIWKGQRILDKDHIKTIKDSVGANINILDSGYSIINYKEENANGKLIVSSYLIDGQHRASVINDYYNNTICEADFNVTVREKTVESETDAIEYFNTINNVKAQNWKIDPNLLINNYITALEKSFNKDKKCLLIRPNLTARPYLSVTSLREVFLTNKEYLKNGNGDIQKFVETVKRYNKETIDLFSLELTQNNIKDSKLKQRAVDIGFVLAYDTKLKWIRKILLDL